MPLPSVMQVVDSLAAGGLERVAVNIANALAADGYRSYLCATRNLGPLADNVSNDVRLLHLHRLHVVDLAAIRQFRTFVHNERIDVLHAHGSSLFFTASAYAFGRRPSVVWHDHYGRWQIAPRNPTPYRLATKRVDAIISVNKPLALWSHDIVGFPTNRVWYVPNFVVEHDPGTKGCPIVLPGEPGFRIVCVANLRPEKGHHVLIDAFSTVLKSEPRSHLLLVGATTDDAHAETIRKDIERRGLAGSVTILGSITNVPQVLSQCDIGVLSSLSEGLPLALLEYGMAQLPVVCTSVGECPEVLDSGRAGHLVPPGSASQLASAILRFQSSPSERKAFGLALRRRVDTLYGREQAVSQLTSIYGQVVSNRA